MAAVKRRHEGEIAGLYDLDKTLGRGHFAVVKLARHVFTGEKVAVKVIDKTKLDAAARGQLFQEVCCMKRVQHPHVVRLYEVIDTATKLYLILELADGGDMYDCIMRHEGGLGEEVAKRYFAQMVHAICYCHQMRVAHRDLKPENVVFFRRQGLVKLTDFGFSHRFQPGQALSTSCGSLAYSAPEVLLGDHYDAPAVDIWSLGVILFMLVCGHPPFQETNDSETLTRILDCLYSVPPHVSPACSDLIGQMLQRDPKKRTSLERIQEHDWLRGVDPSPATKLATPLVSHRSLSEEEHGSVVQRLVLGGIADRDTVTEALEANRYNHVTATYFLLAERALRERQEKENHGGQTRSASPSKAQFRQSWPTRVDVHQDLTDGLGGPGISHPGGPTSPARSAESLHRGARPRTALPPPGPPAPLRPGPPGFHGQTRSPSLFSVEEDDDEEEEGEGGGATPLAVQVVMRPKGGSAAKGAGRLTCRMSAPVLNQIHEEASDDEEVEEEGEEEDAVEGRTKRGTADRNRRLAARLSAPSPVAVTTPVSSATPSPESSCSSSSSSSGDGGDTRDSCEAPVLAARGGDREPIVRADRGPPPPSPHADPHDPDGGGGGVGARDRGPPRPPSGLVESLKLMSLCLSSQFHSLTGGGATGGGATGDKRRPPPPQRQRGPVWRMCVGGSTGSLDKVSLLGGPAPRATLHPRRPAPPGDPLLGTLRLGQPDRDLDLDLDRDRDRDLDLDLDLDLEDRRKQKRRPLSAQRSPREGLLLFPPTPRSCCQVI